MGMPMGTLGEHEDLVLAMDVFWAHAKDQQKTSSLLNQA